MKVKFPYTTPAKANEPDLHHRQRGSILCLGETQLNPPGLNIEFAICFAKKGWGVRSQQK